MRLSELDYDLPEELIAQAPPARRDEARLQVIDRRRGTFEYSRFYKLADYLGQGDLLVLNDTRVFAARLYGRKESGGKVELLLIRPLPEPPGAWLALIGSRRLPKEKARLIVADGAVLRLLGYQRPGRVIVTPESASTIEALIERAGVLALPPYVRRAVRPEDLESYQTVYAARAGAVAAPTAGLHFTQALIGELAASGVGSVRLTLHIGPATFAPIREAEVEAHSMEAEWYAIPEATLKALYHARRVGGRVVAVGTSSARALESYAITGDVEGYTGLFIHPGFRFKLVDAMITNFHMPRSTVLALVMAFAGRELMMNAYRDAIRHRLRLLSYGEAMLVL